MRKRRLNWRGKLLLAYIVCQIIFPLIMKTETPEISSSEENYIPEENYISEESKSVSIPLRATYYYPGDPTGSGEWVGAGYHISSFDINERGWYTFNGKVVVATATVECLKTKKGVCGKWNTPRDGIIYFSYGDEITIVVEDQSYEAIVLDTCGTSMNGENKIDIFVPSAEYGYDGPIIITLEKER